MENCINPPAFVASDCICHGYGNHTLLKFNTSESEWWYMARERFALQAHFSPNLEKNMLDFTFDYFAAGNSQDLGIHAPPTPVYFNRLYCMHVFTISGNPITYNDSAPCVWANTFVSLHWLQLSESVPVIQARETWPAPIGLLIGSLRLNGWTWYPNIPCMLGQLILVLVFACSWRRTKRDSEDLRANLLTCITWHGFLVRREIVQHTNMDWVLLTCLTHSSNNKYGYLR